MTHKTLNQYRRALKKFATRAGTNVALYNAERSSTYQRFKEGIEKSLVKQVNYIIGNPLYMEQIFSVRKYESPKDVLSVVSDLWVDNEFNVRFNELMNYAKLSFYLDWAGSIGGQEALDKLGVDAVFNLKNTDLLRLLRTQETVLVEDLDNVTRNYIGQKIADGMENFLTPDETARLIADELSQISKTRAEVIVQTETARAISMVQVETFKRNGIREKEWMTSRDERVCPICGPLHGTKIPIDEEFGSETSSGVFVESYPPIHPRCRCDLLEVIPKDYISNQMYFIGE